MLDEADHFHSVASAFLSKYCQFWLKRAIMAIYNPQTYGFKTEVQKPIGNVMVPTSPNFLPSVIVFLHVVSSSYCWLSVASNCIYNWSPRLQLSLQCSNLKMVYKSLLVNILSFYILQLNYSREQEQLERRCNRLNRLTLNSEQLPAACVTVK